MNNGVQFKGATNYKWIKINKVVSTALLKQFVMGTATQCNTIPIHTLTSLACHLEAFIYSQTQNHTQTIGMNPFV